MADRPRISIIKELMMLVLRLIMLAGAALAACNGHNELCSRKYSEVTNIGSHDSAFVGFIPVDNQYDSVTSQLDAGIRFLQAQTHDDDGTIEMCHTSCWELDAGPLTEYLQGISDWVKANTNEILTLLITNQDAIDISQFDAAFQSTGLKNVVFHPNGTLSKDEWPTLQELIDANTRVLVFMDYHTDASKADYIMNEFDYFWETKYDVTDKNFADCSVDRPSGGDPTRLMGIMNHFLDFAIGSIDIPDQIDAGTTNSLSSINNQINLCKQQHSTQPNVVLLDWTSIGDASKAQLQLNGLS